MIPARDKIVSLAELARAAASARAQGRRVVQCHGVFDLLHIGHVRHFEAARRMGDLLFVTVTPDRFVNKGPHRPVFNERLRAESAAALQCVDLVALNETPTAVAAIKAVRPAVYVKGSDYRRHEKDRTGGIAKEQAAVRAAGGRLAHTDDISFSSSRLLNRHLPALTLEQSEYLAGLARRHTTAELVGYVDGARRLKVLAVGEAIIDEYRYCEAIGKSSKAPTLVVKKLDSEFFAGGILAVANHVASFCDRVGLTTFLGRAPSRLDFIRRKLRPNVRPTFLYRGGAPTIVKTRYVESYHFTKLLEVYEIDDSLMDPRDRRRLARRLAAEAGRYDAVIVADYGHGMLDDEAIRLLRRKARFLAVNTQSNAGNLGYHTIGRYRGADLICLAEPEARMEARDRRGELDGLIERLARRLGHRRVLVTRGKYGCVAYDRRIARVPAFAGEVQDRVGAGDAFLSLAALCAAQGAPLELAGFLGNLAGAQAVATVGNREPVDKLALVRHIESLLK